MGSLLFNYLLSHVEIIYQFPYFKFLIYIVVVGMDSWCYSRPLDLHKIWRCKFFSFFRLMWEFVDSLGERGSTYFYNLDELLFVFFNWYFRLDWHFFCLIILDTNQFFLTIFDMYKMFIALKTRTAFFIKEIYFLCIFLLSIDTI